MNKKLITAASIALAACVAIGGTIAYLWDSESVTNTFTVGKVEIQLDETNETHEYKVTPGATTPKDPKVMVKENSEDSWLFAVVTNTTDCITYEKADGWDALTSSDDVEVTIPENSVVYYRHVPVSEQGEEYSVF